MERDGVQRCRGITLSTGKRSIGNQREKDPKMLACGTYS
jgi:hypothetical protein